MNQGEEMKSFTENLRRRGNLIRRNNGISWQLNGENREGYLGVIISYAGLKHLRWVKKTQYDDKTRWPYVVPLYMEI